MTIMDSYQTDKMEVFSLKDIIQELILTDLRQDTDLTNIILDINQRYQVTDIDLIDRIIGTSQKVQVEGFNQKNQNLSRIKSKKQRIIR